MSARKYTFPKIIGIRRLTSGINTPPAAVASNFRMGLATTFVKQNTPLYFLARVGVKVEGVSILFSNMSTIVDHTDFGADNYVITLFRENFS